MEFPASLPRRLKVKHFTKMPFIKVGYAAGSAVRIAPLQPASCEKNARIHAKGENSTTPCT
jgi:hypothetical protein